MGRRVFIATRNLLFRATLGAAVTAAGGEVVPDATACDLAVIEIEPPDAMDRIRGLVAGGIPVLAYGPHVRADLLHAARDVGAIAVPNSEAERELRVLLAR
jgi:hypothetical protein